MKLHEERLFNKKKRRVIVGLVAAVDKIFEENKKTITITVHQMFCFFERNEVVSFVY